MQYRHDMHSINILLDSEQKIDFYPSTSMVAVVVVFLPKSTLPLTTLYRINAYLQILFQHFCLNIASKYVNVGLFQLNHHMK